jgi:hypothetical protein
MKKMVLRGAVILGIALVLGLGLTSCALEDATIYVTNNSNNTANVYLYFKGASLSIDQAAVPVGSTVMFTSEAGDYALEAQIIGGNRHDWPQDGSYYYMSGTYRFEVTKAQIRRTN